MKLWTNNLHSQVECDPFTLNIMNAIDKSQSVLATELWALEKGQNWPKSKFQTHYLWKKILISPFLTPQLFEPVTCDLLRAYNFKNIQLKL